MLGRWGAFGAGFVTTMLLTRILPVADVGVYFIVLSLVLILGPLANVGLFLVTLPVTIVVMIAGSSMGLSSMPMPSGHGYLGDHALYYFPAVVVTAAIWWIIGRLIDRGLAR